MRDTVSSPIQTRIESSFLPGIELYFHHAEYLTGAEATIAQLFVEGVELVLGIPGEHNLALCDLVLDFPPLRFIGAKDRDAAMRSYFLRFDAQGIPQGGIAAIYEPHRFDD